MAFKKQRLNIISNFGKWGYYHTHHAEKLVSSKILKANAEYLFWNMLKTLLIKRNKWWQKIKPMCEYILITDSVFTIYNIIVENDCRFAKNNRIVHIFLL